MTTIATSAALVALGTSVGIGAAAAREPQPASTAATHGLTDTDWWADSSRASRSAAPRVASNRRAPFAAAVGMNGQGN